MLKITYEFALIYELTNYMPGLPPKVTLQKRTNKKPKQNPFSD